MPVTLYQAVPVSKKMQTVCLPLAELGGTELVGVRSAQCGWAPGPDGPDAARAAWAVWCRAGAAVSKVPPPIVRGPVGFADVLPELGRYDLVLMCYEHADNPAETRRAIEQARDAQSVALLVGPERGWTPEEVEQARDAGAQIITLGPRIIRAEFAAAAALAWISYETEIGGESK